VLTSAFVDVFHALTVQGLDARVARTLEEALFSSRGKSGGARAWKGSLEPNGG
jgi:hypothetical protein